MKVAIRSRNQVTLPDKVLKELNLSQGDEFIIEVAGGLVRLIPALTIPKDEAYLFTPEWQQAIHQAERELAGGDYTVFENVDELLKDLNS